MKAASAASRGSWRLRAMRSNPSTFAVRASHGWMEARSQRPARVGRGGGEGGGRLLVLFMTQRPGAGNAIPFGGGRRCAGGERDRDRKPLVRDVPTEAARAGGDAVRLAPNTASWRRRPGGGVPGGAVESGRVAGDDQDDRRLPRAPPLAAGVSAESRAGGSGERPRRRAAPSRSSRSATAARRGPDRRRRRARRGDGG